MSNAPFADCWACVAGACAELQAECNDDAECAAWLTCANACEGGSGLAACLDACDDAAIGLAPSHLIYACGCNACPTECGGEVEACTRKCNDGGPPAAEDIPTNLSDTGLFDDDGEVAPWARSFQPEYPLWSDGATKNRWVYIPTCSPVGTEDPDHWQFPVGARLWKEFTRDGVRIETRLIHRYGPNQGDWAFATYHWQDNATDATLVTGGVTDANGTGHDIPPTAACTNCHGKLPERVLGFSALQISHDLGGVDIGTLGQLGLTSTQLPEGGFVIPDDGTGTARAALGYLHSNCGNCHNPSMPVPDMDLRVLTTNASVEDTATYTTAVDVLTTMYQPGLLYRIDSGDPANSAILERIEMSTMPPIASEIPDDAGAETVQEWILSLP